jgi:type 1 fimbriae regulatory protein FimB/type 1 fimbriae regulatory protein FimE
MVMLAYGHGLRVSELVSAQWWREHIPLTSTTVNLKDGWIWIKRAKGSKSGQHNLRKCEMTELRAMLKELKKANPDYKQVGNVFRNERSKAASITGNAFHKILARAGQAANLGFPVHPHMLRHACGHKMLNVDKTDVVLVQEWLGHRNIRHTQHYAKVDPARLEGLWKD